MAALFSMPSSHPAVPFASNRAPGWFSALLLEELLVTDRHPGSK